MIAKNSQVRSRFTKLLKTALPVIQLIAAEAVAPSVFALDFFVWAMF